YGTLTPLEFSSTPNNLGQEIFGGAEFASQDETGNGEFAYFSFQVEAPDSQGIFDINTDAESFIDTELFLFNQETGELLATNDDFFDESDESDDFSFDSKINFTFAEAGNYVIGVGAFDSEASDGSLITGEAVAVDESYDLLVSLANAADGETNLLGTNPNPNRGLASNSGLLALANGTGGAGRIELTTSILTVKDDGVITASNTSSDGGNVNLNVQELRVLDGGEITSSTRTGTAGTVSINRGDGDRPANSILVRGGGSQIAAAAEMDGGNAGGVNLNVQDLRVLDRGVITSSTRTGDAGNVSINRGNGDPATTILVSGHGAQITASNSSSGEGGNVNINVQELRVLDGGQITASTNTGVAGDVVVNHPNSPANFIIVSGADSKIEVATGVQLEQERAPGESNYLDTSIRANQMEGDNKPGGTSAGNIRLDTWQLTVEDGGEISVRSENGSAGRLFVRANAITLDDGYLTARTAARSDDNDSASIELELGAYHLFSSDNHLANSLILRNGSEIRADAIGQANGGNITVNAREGFIIGTGNSDIIATAQQGDGGIIELNALQLFIFGLRLSNTNADNTDTADRLRNNTTSDVSASSEFGNDGAVIIDSLGVDPSEGLEELPAAVVTVPPVDAVCVAQRQGNNEFVQIGRGGVLAQPSNVRTGTLPLPGWVTPDSVVFNPDSSSPTLAELDTTINPAFVEAQGWQRDDDQTLRLTPSLTNMIRPPLLPWRNKLCDPN
ncbi:MAG: S-layer family protein, partial [Cyanothece sp. SIO2G6]|nr:S-layer family protein [Cyanothece sp. SIO2G6]